MRIRKVKVLLPVALCGILLVGSIMWRREVKVNKLLPQGESARRSSHRFTRQERIEYAKRRELFEQLLRSRHQRDVSVDLAALLNDPVTKDLAPNLRVRVVRALGRLENPSVQSALVSASQETQGAGAENKSDDALQMQSQLALGRTRGRDLQGSQKINALLGEAGLSFGDVARLSQKINSDPNRPVSIHYEGTPGYAALDETVDVLYEMGKNGEDIGSWQNQLTLRKAQELMLQGAALPEQQEIDLLLDHLGQVKVYTDGELAEHLIDVSPVASSSAAIERLKDLRDHPDKYREAACYAFFRIPESLKDRRAIPVLKQVRQMFSEKVGTRTSGRTYWMYREAYGALETIQSRD